MTITEGTDGLPGASAPAHGAEPLGRQRELAVIERFLREVPSSGGSLLLEGEEGIGKTTLWEVARVHSIDHGFRVLTSSPGEPESDWPHVALMDLLSPNLDEVLSHLPGPQTRALEAALLRSEAEAQVDHRTLSVAVLGALKLLADAGPVVLCIDDMHWMDHASAVALSFALRRLGHAPVATVAAARPDRSASLDLARRLTQHVLLSPLDAATIAGILRQRLGASLPRPTLLRIHAETGGNPLHAIEVTTALLRTGSSPRAGEPLPITESLRRLLRERLTGLSPHCRRLVLLVAAQPRITSSELSTIAGDGFEAALDEALRVGVLMAENGRLRVTHPLLASAAYSAASPDQRRTAHRALADAAPDPERRARHLAQSAVTPHAEVAAAVEDGARALAQRGAPAEAAALFERSCMLTPPGFEGHLRRRMVAAAEHYRLAGYHARSKDILSEPVSSWPAGRELAQALTTLAHVHADAGDPHKASALFRRALDEVGDDPEVRMGSELGLAWTSLVSGAWAAAVQHARRAVDLAEIHKPALGTGAVLATLVEATFLSGGGVDAPSIEQALSVEQEEPVPTTTLLVVPSYVCGSVLKWAGDLEAARPLLHRALRRAEDCGDEDSYALTHYHLAELECWAGRWDVAGLHASQALEASPPAGQARATGLYACALVDAHSGRLESARAFAEEGVAVGQEAGATTRLIQNLSVLGFCALSLGDARTAHSHLGPATQFSRAVGVSEPGVLRFVPDEIEALVLMGQLDEAEAVLDWFERLARSTHRAWAIATAARCRGLLLGARGELGAAVDALKEATLAHEHVLEPFERARTLMVLGATLRRTRRKATARDALGEASQTFEDLGAQLWWEHAQDELSRIGGRARATGSLTPTEKQVATLVIEGRTNREIAGSLYMTVKAVEGNLTRIYRKLGVRSRTELVAHRARVSDPAD